MHAIKLIMSDLVISRQVQQEKLNVQPITFPTYLSIVTSFP